MRIVDSFVDGAFAGSGNEAGRLRADKGRDCGFATSFPGLNGTETSATNRQQW
jgi:hypothetical protein